MRPGNCLAAREASDVLGCLSEVAELINALPVHQYINKSAFTLGGLDVYSFLPPRHTFYILHFIHFLCAGLMYFIELVTTEHKLGITTLCLKKITPPPHTPSERIGRNLFLIYPSSLSLHLFHALLFVTQPAFQCMQKLSNIVFFFTI